MDWIMTGAGIVAFVVIAAVARRLGTWLATRERP